ncbi:hypothetical protein POTOM_045995 [Populus tomentosa]|uniref:Uncharacterized protein n=1 Tax=Populus tomentosa TaxID=118781 RepID=A0A8X8CC95_POPTO|nr:hypothetical protein POTOM_045995 [Populus tomentosa]
MNSNVKHKYMIASSSTVSEGRRNHPLPEGKQKEMLKLEKSKNKILTKAQVDQDLLKIRGMTASEAAAAAAAAVAEAETAIAEAEAAAREAEKAEAEAEAAQVFAKAAIKAFKHRACHPCIITIFLSTYITCFADGSLHCWAQNMRWT